MDGGGVVRGKRHRWWRRGRPYARLAAGDEFILRPADEREREFGNAALPGGNGTRMECRSVIRVSGKSPRRS